MVISERWRWQIVVAALLERIGQRQVTNDLRRWQRQPDRREYRADPFPALADGLVWDADHSAVRRAVRHLDLHNDRQGIDALKVGGIDAANVYAPGRVSCSARKKGL